MILRDGKIVESMTIAILDPKANVNDSNIKIHIENIPFPLNRNSRYGIEVNSKLNKIYLTIEGKSQDFLSIIDLNFWDMALKISFNFCQS